MAHLLNADGTVNLELALAEQRAAERACTVTIAAMRAAEREVNGIPSYRIEHGRALARLEVARSNYDGAVERCRRAAGTVDEALNPGAY